MIDIDELTKAIKKDSAAMWEWREKLPEQKRPTDLQGLQDLLKDIQTFVEKNDHYQRESDRLRHEQNAKQRGRGDEIVRPAWEAKISTREFPWAFNTNLIELIKIFHHCYPPLIETLKKDLSEVSSEIEKGLVTLPSKRHIRSIREEMGRIMSTFQWLRKNWRVYYLDQIDTSGKEHTSFQEVPPGVPNMMDEFEKKLAIVSDRQNKLEEKWRAGEAQRLGSRGFWVSIAAIVIALLTFSATFGAQILDAIKNGH